MKKTVFVFFLLILTSAFLLTSCNDKPNNDGLNTDTGENALLTSKSLTVNGTEISARVSNANETFSFANDISVAPNATWVLSLDIYGIHNVVTKTVPLNEGSNTFYIHIIAQDQSVTTYTVNIYRNHLYSVAFNSNGGTTIPTQYVDEGAVISEPATNRVGYTLDSWDYDFNTPITSDLTLSATWSPRSDTKYTVEYYLELANGDGYSEPEIAEFYGTTDTLATVEKTYEHFTLDTTKGTVSGNISGDGSLVLKAYYNQKLYTVDAWGDINTVVDGMCPGGHAHLALPTACNPIIDGYGDYTYGSRVTLVASTSAVCTFIGWYDGDVKVCDNETFSFTVENNVKYVAKWVPNENTKHYVQYNYESSFGYESETLELTGIISKEDIIKNIEHYTLECVSSNIGGDGALYYTLAYRKNIYTINVNIEYLSSSNSNARIVGGYTCGPTYMYVTAEQKVFEEEYGRAAILIAPEEEGYTFLGWFDENDVKVSDSISFSFTVKGDASYTARYISSEDV